MGYLRYDRPYLSFGCDLLHTPPEQTYAVNYLNGIYQYIKGNFLLQFDGQRTTGVYDYRHDPQLRQNLAGQVPVQGIMEREVKAIIQRLIERDGDLMACLPSIPELFWELSHHMNRRQNTASAYTRFRSSGLQEVVEEVSAKVPYFFFSHDYVLPLSSAAGTVCEVPGVKCMEVWSHIVRGFFDPESAEDSARGQAFSFIPPPAADKDYYVFALRRIVV